MKIAIYSDIHLEFGSKIFYNPEAEVIIFAGDIDVKAKAFEKIRQVYKDQKIIYVNGNHEYYGEHFAKIIEKSQLEAKKHDINFLNNQLIEIDDLIFYGGTMWTNFTLHGNPLSGSFFAKEKLNDYKKIRVENYRRIYPEFVKREYEKFMNNLKKLLEDKKEENKKIVVISHMAPSTKSFAAGMEKEDTASAYAVNLENFILDHQEKIALWCHGHIHNSSDYHLGKTRIIANPFGYLFQPNPDFKNNLIIEVKNNKIKPVI